MNKAADAALLARARAVLRLESKTVAAQIRAIGPQFLKAVHLISHCPGHVVVVGVGKSGLIGRKITATLASTGTPSAFVHPAEGMHGDLGMITRRDIVLALSYSGETEEVKRLIPSIRAMQVPLLAFTARPHSRLARMADVVLPVYVRREACPYNLTPTTSTTAMLALGDALAMAVMDSRGFKPEDFARLHPGGVLGKRLLWTVEDIMHRGAENPVVRQDQPVREALRVMTKTRTGAASVVNQYKRLVGYFTDGDFRRLAPRDPGLLGRPMKTVMTQRPHVLKLGTRIGVAAEKLRQYRCDNIPVVDGHGRPVGLVDERDLLSEGLL
ncbi:MAG TPA: KpsF/GutQ family sugar-phosphate isomerase [Elusimicrobiota bacterium]|nr:KpsF/GutQ family sugar-phosphate isomerase [Elusimicrobiota bacterium]